MIWEWQGIRYEDCAVIYKVDGEYGDLSNMSNGFPLQLCGVTIPSSEALFQMCRYSHKPEWQEEIMGSPHAMQAKMKARKESRPKEGRPDWEQIKADVMRWVLRIKLASYPRRMAALVRWSGKGPLVEQSKKDREWGAVLEADNILRGENLLGRLWGEIRDEVRAKFDANQERELLMVPPPNVEGLTLLGRPLEAFIGTGEFGRKTVAATATSKKGE
jgi:ribA/ribD-fused uncharacterized protein